MLDPGTQVGSFEVLGLLGEGGAGVVYRVRHRVLGTDHALKVLREERLASETVRDRFLAEARIQAQLRHPNILTVTEIVSAPGVAGLVMDFVDGRSLAEEIASRSTPPSPDEVRRLFLPILDAVGFAHAKGVIHRDLKPENILLDHDHRGELRPRVCDFGVAKLLGDLSNVPGAKRSTIGDRALGTHGYMSPEQIRSAKDVDPRTDIFSLGATIFEYATGELPFRGDSDFDIMTAAVGGEFRVPESLERTDPVLAEALRRALRPAREDRFASCAEFAAALSLPSPGAAPRPPVEPKAIAREPGTARPPDTVRADRPVIGPAVRKFVWAAVLGIPVILAYDLLSPTGMTTTPRSDATPAAATVAPPPADPVSVPPPPLPPVAVPDRPAVRTDMVTVPAGPFFMGCNVKVDYECSPDEMPGRQENVGAFSIDKTEVTVSAYRKCVESGACSSAGLTVPFWDGEAKPTGAEFCTWGKPGRDAHPINCVDWNQATAYCSWAGKRLPTEAEREKAARGTDGRKYPWGNAGYGSSGRVANIADESAKRTFSGWSIAEGYDDGYVVTSPVGSFPAGVSPYGALDLIGNVWEWTSSDYDSSTKSVRGGSWFNGPRFARASTRYRFGPDARNFDVGFRCAQ